jgi:hypothetical protein
MVCLALMVWRAVLRRAGVPLVDRNGLSRPQVLIARPHPERELEAVGIPSFPGVIPYGT